MTVAEMLARMAVYDSELRTGTTGVHETIATRALNMAQDALEAVIASRPKMMQTYSTLTTTANVEATDWPNDLSTGVQLLRLDALWVLDANSRPLYMLDDYTIVGGHYPQAPPPLNLVIQTVSPQSGRPRGYYSGGPGAQFNWSPIPDAVYTMRWYGFASKTTLIAPSVTATSYFGYPDIVADVVIAGAVRAIRIGKDDPADVIAALQIEMRDPALKALARTNRQQAMGRAYSDVHLT